VRINILGCAPGLETAPKQGQGEGEIWGLNDVILTRKVDAVIDCHNLSRIIKGKEKIRRSPETVKKCLKEIKRTNTLCYSIKEIKNAPSVKPYPLKEIIKEFDSDYFGSGPDYALALAIYKGATEIHTYGILMVCTDEYFYQKPSFEHWLGIAKGRRIKTVIHDSNNLSSILRLQNGLLYGYHTPQRWKQRVLDDPTKFIEAYT